METYFGFLVLMLFALLNAGALLYLTQRFGPRRSSPIHDMPFETGQKPREILRGRFSVKFFLVAILFILFDVELMFLFPWALAYRELGLYGFVVMGIFLAIVAAGLFYEVKRGALEWK